MYVCITFYSIFFSNDVEKELKLTQLTVYQLLLAINSNCADVFVLSAKRSKMSLNLLCGFIGTLLMSQLVMSNDDSPDSDVDIV